MKPNVLCVDDDPNLLKGISLILGRKFNVHTATSAELGLNLLTREGPMAAVLSDMRMPGIDGAHFLACVRSKWPDTVRLLLTGQTDVESAIRAVNNGQIFRFLTKPCSPDELAKALQAAVDQHNLLRSERDLLERTVKGSIEALVGLLSLASPEAFGRGDRIRRHAVMVAEELQVSETWIIETAALLSQIGFIILSPDTAAKVNRGIQLNAEESCELAESMEHTRKLLIAIPRLQPIQDVLDKWRETGQSGQMEGSEKPSVAGILRVVSAFDELETRGMDAQTAFDTLRCRRSEYSLLILESFARMHGQPGRQGKIEELPLAGIQVGMIFTQDLKSNLGALLVARGYCATESLLVRLKNLPKNTIAEPIPMRMSMASAIKD